ncbi:hypothetical protein B0H14DRAFT_2599597 [Mycena olivaceomarginata]|nr:hypothetical protein B0H14DRAFT_2599597 [Mycena olivaceomarginata]
MTWPRIPTGLRRVSSSLQQQRSRRLGVALNLNIVSRGALRRKALNLANPSCATLLESNTRMPCSAITYPGVYPTRIPGRAFGYPGSVEREFLQTAGLGEKGNKISYTQRFQIGRNLETARSRKIKEPKEIGLIVLDSKCLDARMGHRERQVRQSHSRGGSDIEVDEGGGPENNVATLLVGHPKFAGERVAKRSKLKVKYITARNCGALVYRNMRGGMGDLAANRHGLKQQEFWDIAEPIQTTESQMTQLGCIARDDSRKGAWAVFPVLNQRFAYPSGACPTALTWRVKCLPKRYRPRGEEVGCDSDEVSVCRDALDEDFGGNLGGNGQNRIDDTIELAADSFGLLL